jgi:RimJ/RimL family protein N-acetyltransferase
MSTIAIPTLRTARLTLPAFREADLAEYAAMLGDPAMVRFLGDGKPRTVAATWAAMARALGQWGLRGYGLFAVVAPDGRLAGHAGILHPHVWPEPELAYAIAPAFQGLGFATEACQAVRAWAWHARGIGSLVSFIRPANAASIAVVRKLGAHLEATLELVGAPALRFRHGAPPGEMPAFAAPTLIETPALHTPRLRLRAFTAGDFAPLSAIHADAEVMRYLGDGKPRDPAATWANMALWLGGWGMRGDGYLAVTDAATGALLGRAGVLDIYDWPEPEIGYTLRRESWGQGLAVEAAGAIRDWAWAALRPASLVSFVKLGNAASANVARKLGARMTGVITLEDRPTERWEYQRPE